MLPSRRSAHFALLALSFSLLAACDRDGPSSSGPSRTSHVDASEPGAASTDVVVTPVERKVFVPSKAGCEKASVMKQGERAGEICVEDAESLGLTVVDLSDGWTPRIFTADAKTGSAPEYRAKYLELAANPNADLGLHGIAPNLSILAARVSDTKRASCDAAIDRAALVDLDAERAATSEVAAQTKVVKRAESGAVMRAMQETLVCEGFLKKASVTGRSGQATHAALEPFRKRHMVVGLGVDAATVHALALGSDELAYRGLLRGLRERVVDATGLLEDGTASESFHLVAGRELDFSRFAPRTHERLENGAPDLVDAATDAAVRELGWTSPEATRQGLAALDRGGVAKLKVALELPKAPAYHADAMELRVEIDRGDVYKTPAHRLRDGKRPEDVRPPTFVLYAKDGDREVALMRWATTIGGWKKERKEDGEIGLEYKESDVGDRYWRQLIAAPAWLPPESTPETDLVKEDAEGNLAVKRDLVQPGYRNAYGLVMLIHHEEVRRGGKVQWADHGIRTHGSVDYRSIKNGTSHGCHRLYNQLALRLSGFLLEHRTHARKGKMQVDFRRTLEIEDKTVELDVPSRGYLYELDPPVPVKVLKGNTGREEPKSLSSQEPSEPAKSAVRG
jgi:hypothetical protein